MTKKMRKSSRYANEQRRLLRRGALRALFINGETKVSKASAMAELNKRLKLGAK